MGTFLVEGLTGAQLWVAEISSSEMMSCANEAAQPSARLKALSNATRPSMTPDSPVSSVNPRPALNRSSRRVQQCNKKGFGCLLLRATYVGCCAGGGDEGCC